MATANIVVEGLVNRGIPRNAAIGLAGNAFVESGFDPGINEISPLLEGSRGGFSLFQWTGPRRRQYEAFAGDKGLDPSDIETALDFTAWELANTEKKAADRIYSAETPEDAARATSVYYLRPGIPHLERRVEAATRIAQGEDIQGTYTDAAPAIPLPDVERVTDDKNLIQRAYEAFTSGAMSSDQIEAYTADVRSGRMPVPAGAVVGQRIDVSQETVDEVYRRYTAGELSAEQAADYEGDVRAGIMPLPQSVAAPRVAQAVAADDPLRPRITDPAAPQPETTRRPLRERLSEDAFEASRRAALGLVGGEGAVDLSQDPIVGGTVLETPLEVAGDVLTTAGGALSGAYGFGVGAIGDLLKSAGVNENQVERLARDIMALPEAFAGSPQSVMRAPRPSLPRRTPDPAPITEATPPATAIVETADAAEVGSLVRRAADGSDRALEELARVSKVNPEAAAAADRLGIELPPDVLSDHQMVREAAGLTRSVAGTPASVAWRETLIKSIDQADEAIRQLGGSPDLSAISDDVLTSLRASQKTLGDRASKLYDTVDNAVPRNSQFIPDNVVKALNQSITDLGGLDGLTRAERSLFQMVTGDQPVTYARLMREKEAIGKALGGMDSPYGNSDRRTLSRLYGALSDDQVANVERIGGQELRENLELANGLTAKKKALEERIVSAFGKDLEGSIASTLRSAITQAAKGDSAKLNRLMSVIPKELQREAVASSIAAATRSARATEPGFGFAEYSKFYGNLRGNSKVYSQIVDILGPEGHRIMRDLSDISKRVTDARANVLTTGKANQAIVNSMLAENIVGRMLNTTTGRRVTQATTTGAGAMTGGPVGAMFGAAVTDILSIGKKDRMGAAGNVFTSDQFRNLAEEAATTGRVSDATVSAVASSKPFRKWADMAGITDPRNWINGVIISSIADETQQETE